MNELEKLIAENQALTLKLQALQAKFEDLNDGSITSGRAKLAICGDGYGKHEEWTVSYKRNYVNSGRDSASRYVSLIVGKNRAEVVEQINDLVTDLIDLRDRAQ